MTERFRLAANFLLKRRLNNLVKIDNNVEIDRGYITCAEYQLFIDDMRQEGKNIQPDHWTSLRFPPGSAKKPVTGVRSGDAEEFCQWLTRKESISRFSYRLPNLAETTRFLATTEGIGFWCKKENTLTISGITSQKWRFLQQKLSKYLIVRNNFILNRDFYRDINHALYLSPDLYREPDLYRVLQVYQDLYRNLFPLRDRDHYRALYRVLEVYRDVYRKELLYKELNLYLNRDRELYKVLNRDRELYRDRVLYKVLDLDLNLDLNLDLYQDLYNKINSNQVSNELLIYFLLIFVIFIYQLLNTFYRKTAQNKNIQQKMNLNSQKCEEISQEYAQKRDKIYEVYVYLVLIDERRKGNMPAWEGIRIVREREEIN